jgi:hypothetical protein
MIKDEMSGRVTVSIGYTIPEGGNSGVTNGEELGSKKWKVWAGGEFQSRRDGVLCENLK